MIVLSTQEDGMAVCVHRSVLVEGYSVSLTGFVTKQIDVYISCMKDKDGLDQTHE